MTTVIIKSDSEKKTRLLIELAGELGLSANTKDFEELDINSLAQGIGRKATDEELIDYLERNQYPDLVSLENAFSKYSDKAK